MPGSSAGRPLVLSSIPLRVHRPSVLESRCRASAYRRDSSPPATDSERRKVSWVLLKGVPHGLTPADSRGREGEYFPKAHGAGVQLG